MSNPNLGWVKIANLPGATPPDDPNIGWVNATNAEGATPPTDPYIGAINAANVEGATPPDDPDIGWVKIWNLNGEPANPALGWVEIIGLTPTPPPPPVIPTLYHILITGQSNSLGGSSLPQFAQSNPNLLVFNTGLRAGSTSLLEFQTLNEVTNGSVSGQTIATSMGQRLALNFPDDKFLFGVNATVATYIGIKKGTEPYLDSLAQITAAKTIAESLGWNYRVLCLCLLHGEWDQAFENHNYDANVAELQSDFSTDALALSGQTEPVKLLMSQQVGSSPDQAVDDTASSALAMDVAAVAQPDLLKIVGAQFCVDYIDDLHMNNWGQYVIGDAFGKEAAGILSGTERTPFCPISVAFTDETKTAVLVTFPFEITAKYNRVTYQPSLGFQFFDSAGEIEISSVVLVGSTATLALASASAGTSPVIYCARKSLSSYVYRNPPLTGSRSNIVQLATASDTLNGADVARYTRIFKRAVT